MSKTADMHIDEIEGNEQIAALNECLEALRGLRAQMLDTKDSIDEVLKGWPV